MSNTENKLIRTAGTGFKKLSSNLIATNTLWEGSDNVFKCALLLAELKKKSLWSSRSWCAVEKAGKRIWGWRPPSVGSRKDRKWGNSAALFISPRDQKIQIVPGETILWEQIRQKLNFEGRIRCGITLREKNTVHTVPTSRRANADERHSQIARGSKTSFIEAKLKRASLWGCVCFIVVFWAECQRQRAHKHKDKQGFLLPVAFC